MFKSGKSCKEKQMHDPRSRYNDASFSKKLLRILANFLESLATTNFLKWRYECFSLYTGKFYSSLRLVSRCVHSL